MKQRGRKSAAGMAVVRNLPDGLAPPPENFSDEQAEHWRAIVAGKPQEWFDSGNLPLLDAYCRAVVEHRQISDMVEACHPIADDEDFKRYNSLSIVQDRLSKQIASLATKMRLTQSAKYGARGADTASRKAGKGRPWSSD